MIFGHSNGKITTSTAVGTDGTYLRSNTVYSDDGSFVTSEEDVNGNTVYYYYYGNGKLQSAKTVKPSAADTDDTVSHTYVYGENGDLSMEYISGVVSLAYTYTKDSISKILRGGYISGIDTKQEMEYNFTYNPFGRPLAISIGETPLVTYEYPAISGEPAYAGNMNPAVIHLANDNLIGYTYDKLDRVILIQYDDVNKASIRYDRMGNVCRVEDMELGKVYLYEYSDEGVLQYAVVIHADGTQQMMYAEQDENDRTTGAFTGIGLDQSVTATYTYDDSTAISDKLIGSALTYQNGETVINNSFAYSYDSLDRLTAKTLSGNGKTLTSAYAYKTIDGNRTSNLLASLTWTSPEIDTLTFSYTYDLAGNITAAHKNGILIASYTYNVQGQLIYEMLPTQGIEFLYVYDTYGNIRKAFKVDSETREVLDTQIYTYGDSTWLDKLTAFDGNTITYDASGNPLTYNNGSAYTFTWDTARNLTSVYHGGVTTSYKYNADGLRTEKQYGTTTYKYYYDGDKLPPIVRTAQLRAVYISILP